MKNDKIIGRRNFLKLLGTNIAAFAVNLVPVQNTRKYLTDLPKLYFNEIPPAVRGIIRCVPDVEIRQDGYLWFRDSTNHSSQQALVLQTQWNRDRSNSFERLFPDTNWGIVLHWFGASFNGDQKLASYMRGFDGLRKIGNYETRTSAHFLVGEDPLGSNEGYDGGKIGIIQTQIPDFDGTPFVASHLSGLDHMAHQAKEQYFVRAFYELGYFEPSIRSILTDFYDGPRLDPNYRTIAVEITGSNFEQSGNVPSMQQIGNVIGLVSALMIRYKIPIQDILGHHEIEIRKPDPGKHFMALFRYMMGVYTLYSGNVELYNLVFGEFQNSGESPWRGIERYFKFLRDYLVIVGFPDQVYQWETAVNYWSFYRNVIQKTGIYNSITPFQRFISPLKEKTIMKKDGFLTPPDHEGIDLFLEQNNEAYQTEKSIDVLLPADGECIYLGKGSSCGYGYSAIFRHYQEDGAEILTVFSNLSKIAYLNVGSILTSGTVIGKITAGNIFGEGFLHFAIAYGATWETVLTNLPNHPTGASQDWIKRRYISPAKYLRNFESDGNKPGQHWK